MRDSSTTRNYENGGSRNFTHFAGMLLVGLVAAVVAVVAGCATPAPEPDPQAEQSVTREAAVEAAFATQRFILSEFPASIQVTVSGSGSQPLFVRLSSPDGSVREELQVPDRSPGTGGDDTRDVPGPSEGLEAGAEYAIALFQGDQRLDTGEILIDIALPAPELVFPPDGYTTIDPRQELRWQPVPDAAGYLLETGPPGTGKTTQPVDDSESESMFGTGYGTYEWRIRWVRADGLVSPPSPTRSLQLTDDPESRLLPTSVMRATSGYISADNYNGAVAGELEIESQTPETADPEVSGSTVVDDKLLFGILDLEDGASYRYRLRGRPEEGGWTVWTDWQTFQVMDIGVVFLPPVATETFTMGQNFGFGDEDPAHPVALRNPASLQRTPLTNSLLAVAVNDMITTDSVTLEDAAVSLQGTPLVRLGELDYGTQFGITRTDEGRILPVQGKENHPAIGITWYGAVAIANWMAEGFGLPAAYDLNTWSWDETVPSIRLPTEAEWALSARGTTDGSFPWGGSIEPNRMNYYRSFDPFEDVEFPFTRSGGPTTPVGYYDGSRRGTYATAPNSSPSGHQDVVGNVWEWCWDWYSETEFRDRTATDRVVADPRGPETGEFRTVRGCAWNTRAEDLRVTNRGRFAPESGSFSIGVRLALDAPPLEAPISQ